jgi:hypothetical protein
MKSVSSAPVFPFYAFFCKIWNLYSG